MAEKRALTILFADISGSTKLFEARGDEEARRLVAAVLFALSEVAARHGGRVVKTIGDEIMCTFPGALQGLLAATDMQRRVKTDAAFVSENIGIRIGLHHGDALIEGDDVFGDAVNTAARMADKTLAKRDQIVATASTVIGITHTPDLQVRALGHAHVLGKRKPIEIVDVMWRGGASNVTAVQRLVPFNAGAPRARLLVRCRGQTFELDEISAPLTIGRDPSNAIVIEAEWVSRNHALMEWKRGYFVLADQSTNGTWLRIGDGGEMLVHRDEVHLRQGGTISIGQAHDGDDQDLVHFRCAD